MENWERVVRVKAEHAYRSEGVDEYGRNYRYIYVRRQENPVTRTERSIPAHKVANCQMNKTFEKSFHDIADYTSNRLNDFGKAYHESNRLICADYVLAFNPKKKVSPRVKTRATLDYLESLEMANMCRNCKGAIKTRKCMILGIETLVAEIPEHYEVYYCEEKEGLKYRKVAKRTIFNSRCECIMRETRKIERAEKSKTRNLMF